MNPFWPNGPNDPIRSVKHGLKGVKETQEGQALVYSLHPLLCESPSPLLLLVVDSNSLSIAGIDQGVDGSLVIILTSFYIIVHCSLHIRRHYSSYFYFAIPFFVRHYCYKLYPLIY